MKKQDEKHLIKKYPNRRLYDTAISSYVTISDVKKMILEYEDIQIVDAKTGEDLTRSVFLQILSDEEMGGTPIFSDETICQMIRMYGQVSQSLFAPFLEQNMKIFTEWQNNIQEQAKAVGKASKLFSEPFKHFDKNPTSFVEWQNSLQQQALSFWQNAGFIPKDK